MASYTKEQARQEYERYRRVETAAVEAALADYEEQRRRAIENAQLTADEKTRTAAATAAAAFTAARVQQLADSYRLAEQIANRGTTRSGQAALSQRAISRTASAARTAAATRQAATLQQVRTALGTARQRAESDYAANTASARRKLSDKLEQKRMTLERSIKEETV